MSTTSDDVRPTRSGLAGRLRALRGATVPRVSQTAAGRAIGTSQNKISRAESGQWVLTPQDVRTLARLYGATADEQRRLVRWAEALAPGEVDARAILHRNGGTAAFQARVRRLEDGAEVVRAYQPGMILGQLQTESYARVVFRGDTAAVAERMRRNEQLLTDRNRRWRLVQPVGALLWNLGGREVMAEQMDALIVASRLPHVELRIITADQPTTFAVTHGFHLYDEQSVLVGILTGTTISKTAVDVRQYSELHDRLVEVSIGGDEARAAIAQIAADYREGTTSGALEK